MSEITSDTWLFLLEAPPPKLIRITGYLTPQSQLFSAYSPVNNGLFPAKSSAMVSRVRLLPKRLGRDKKMYLLVLISSMILAVLST